jgi:hypothetical protein
MLLSRRSFLASSRTATKTAIVASGPAIASVIVATRWTLGLRFRELTGEGGPSREADLSIGGHLGDHDGYLITDAKHIFDSVDANRWVL